jgi:DNA invertase Pin-like site-specific DNA recombinase
LSKKFLEAIQAQEFVRERGKHVHALYDGWGARKSRRAALTQKEKEAIRELRNTGLGYREIAAQLNLSYYSVYNTVNRTL